MQVEQDTMNDIPAVKMEASALYEPELLSGSSEASFKTFINI